MAEQGNIQDIEQEAARRAYKVGLGASEWEACLSSEELLALMRAYRTTHAGLVEALEPFVRFYAEATSPERGHGGRDTDVFYKLNDVSITLGDLRRAALALAAARGGEGGRMRDTKYTGDDNRGKPKADYVRALKIITDPTLEDECANKIWLSAYASNNPRSDCHWQCDACWDECQSREDKGIYERAWKRASS